MGSRLGWFGEVCIVVALVGTFALAVILISCCACSSESGGREVADWVWVLLQFGLAGAVGGLLTLISQFNPMEVIGSKKNYACEANYWNVALAMLISIMGGIGGAGAAMYFMSFNSKLKIPENGLQILENCLTGFISGFIGFALLRQMAKSFAKLTLSEEERDALARQAARTANEEQLNWRELEDCVQDAREIRKRQLSATDAKFLDARRKLETERARFPEFKEHRRAAIVLANMYYDALDFAKAKGIVSETISAIEPQLTSETEATRQRARKNIADLLYNRACYSAKMVAANESTRATLLPDLVADLDRSFELSPENVREAEAELTGDFNSVKDEQTFKNVIAKHK